MKKRNSITNHQSPITRNLSTIWGFTLVEIIVVIAVLGTLLVGVLLAINPARQIEKSKDAVRQADIQAIKSALETYYHDNNCYPRSLTFGEEWKGRDEKTVYMSKVPQDPDFNANSGANNTYQYRTDAESDCPQWNVVFSKLSAPVATENDIAKKAEACPIVSLSNCTPEGYEEADWACGLSGKVDCGILTQPSSSLAIVPPSVENPTESPNAPSPTSTSTTPTAIPGISISPTIASSGGASITPTPTDVPPTSMSFNIATNGYPWFTTGVVAPYPAKRGNQEYSIVVRGSEPIVNVSARVTTDSGANTYPFALTSGTNLDGVWSATFTITDTIINDYTVKFTAVDSIGRSDYAEIVMR